MTGQSQHRQRAGQPKATSMRCPGGKLQHRPLAKRQAGTTPRRQSMPRKRAQMRSKTAGLKETSAAPRQGVASRAGGPMNQPARAGAKRAAEPPTPAPRKAARPQASAHPCGDEVAPGKIVGPRDRPPQALALAGPAPRAAAALPTRGKRKAPAEWATNGARRSAKAVARVDGLLAELPEDVIESLAGGQQVPCRDRRLGLVRGRLLQSAGPEGDKVRNALRAWRLLVGVARARHLPNHGLPARGMLVADIVGAELDRARGEKKGSKGGLTVGKTILEGFAALQDVVGLPIEADHALAVAAAQPTREEQEASALKPGNHAGSMPIKLQLQLETLAAAQTGSVARTVARAFLVACFCHHVRRNDALNAIIFPDEEDPAGVIRGRTLLKGKPPKTCELYAPAEGWLGPFTWLGEHLTEMAGRPHALPDFEGPVPSRAQTLRGGVLAPTRARDALQDLMSMAPLRMSADEFRALKLTTHSIHRFQTFGSYTVFLRGFVTMCVCVYVCVCVCVYVCMCVCVCVYISAGISLTGSASCISFAQL